MSVRKLKPITPAQRFTVVNGFDALTMINQKRVCWLRRSVVVEETTQEK
jgi:hypothetical protein